MTKEMLRDKSLDWFDRLMNSALLEVICWYVCAFAVLFFTVNFVYRHFDDGRVLNVNCTKDRFSAKELAEI
jgi:hypothetical protein